MILLFLFLASSRIIITEVMSNVKGLEQGPGDRNEFVEIYNNSPDTIDLSTYFLYDLDAPPDEICAWENDSILIKYPNLRIHSTIIYPYSYALIMDREYTVYDTIYYQPYLIPDSTLILTTDDTSIGDGLSTNDPLLIYSIADACTTTFGTPYLDDNFPLDPGKGISWERIDLNTPDSSFNWHPSVDPVGCTPGRENSTTNAYDLALSANLISFTPATVLVGEDVNITIGIINNGLRATNDYQLNIYDDSNQDSILDDNELITIIPGQNAGAFDTIFMYHRLSKPSQGEHLLGFFIDFGLDKEPSNNRCFKNLKVVGAIGELCVAPPIFSPDGDGFDDRLQIDYRLPESGGRLVIAIYDTRGKKVCDVYKNALMTQDKGTCFWEGDRAQTGMYIVYLEYRYHKKIVKAKKTAVLVR